MFSRTSVHGPAEDAWLMILDFTGGSLSDLLHPHHLIYGVIAHLWWRGWELIGLTDSYKVIQSLNCLIGATAVLQLYQFGKDLRISDKASAWAALACGLSFGCWWLSSEIEVASLVLLVTIIWMRYFWFVLREGANVKRLIIAALITTLAVATHIFLFALCLAGVYVFLTARSTLDVKGNETSKIFISKGLIRCFNYLFLTLAIVYGAYFAVDFITGKHTGAIGYFIGYIEPEMPAGFSLKAPLLFFTGVVRSLFGIEIMFRIPEVAQLLAGLFPGKDFSDEIFLVRNLDSRVVTAMILLMLLMGAGLLLILWNSFRKIRHLSLQTTSKLYYLIVCLLAISLPVLLAGPVLYGSTANNEHLLPFWAVFFLGLALINDRIMFGKMPRIFAISFLVILFLINGAGAMMVMSDIDNDIVQSSFSGHIDNVKPGDLMIVHLTDRDAAALMYLTGAKTVNTMYESYPSEIILNRYVEARNNVWIQQVISQPDVKYPSVTGFKLEKWKNEGQELIKK